MAVEPAEGAAAGGAGAEDPGQPLVLLEVGMYGGGVCWLGAAGVLPARGSPGTPVCGCDG